MKTTSPLKCSFFSSLISTLPFFILPSSRGGKMVIHTFFLFMNYLLINCLLNEFFIIDLQVILGITIPSWD